MTPDDLHLIRTSTNRLDPDAFSTTFYATLFELAPDVRAMFPADLADQRRKLMAELGAMITMATSMLDGDLDRFVQRAHRLGDRHVDYGATAAHYDVVGQALLAALSDHIADWDPAHASAWRRLYALVAATMQERAIAR